MQDWSTLKKLIWNKIANGVIEYTGAVVSFVTSTAKQIKSLIASITPAQDLHGYDNPWPAGGNGNLLPFADAVSTTVRGITFTSDGKGTLGISGTSEDSDFNDFTFDAVTFPSEDIYVHLLNPVANANISLFFFNGSTQVAGITLGAINRIYKLAALSSATIDKMRLIVGTGEQVNFTFTPMLMTSGTSSVYIPYSNICPITGFTGANIYVSPTQDQADATVYNVDWTSAAGTVYGGTVDVVSGVLTVDRASVDLGTLNFSLWNRNANRDCFSTSVPIRNSTSSSENIPALSSIFTPTNYNVTWKPWDMSYTNANEQVVFITPHELYADATEFKTAMSGVQFVYELATPLTYTLTPQEVQTLVGQNNVWSDSGDVIVKVIR